MGWQPGPGGGTGTPPDREPGAIGRPGGRDPRLAVFGGDGRAAPVPCGGLALLADQVSGPGRRCAGATGDELIGLLRAWAALESWAAAAKLGVIRELIRRDDTPPGAAWHGDLPDDWSPSLRHEVAAALACSVQSSDTNMWLAWEQQARLPGIGALLGDGTLTFAKARAVTEMFRYLSDADAAAAEALIAGQLAGKTYPQVLRLAERSALTVDPEMAARRREQAQKKDARVVFFREQQGTAGLSGRDLPPDQALAASAAVNARAQAYQESGAFGGARTDVLRAYAYLDLLNGVTSEARIVTAQAQDEAAEAAEALAWAEARADKTADETRAGKGPAARSGSDPRADAAGAADTGTSHAPDPGTAEAADTQGGRVGACPPGEHGDGRAEARDRTGSEWEDDLSPVVGAGPDGPGPDGPGPDGAGPDGAGPDGAGPGDGPDGRRGCHGPGYHGPRDGGNAANRAGASPDGSPGCRGRGADVGNGRVRDGNDGSAGHGPEDNDGTGHGDGDDGTPPGGPGPGGPLPGPGTAPGGRALQPRPSDLIVPLATLLGLAERPGEIHRFGLLDPSLARQLAAAAVASPRTEICVTVTSPEGYAVGHGCARPGRPTSSAGTAGPAPWATTGGIPARLNLTIPASALPGLARHLGRRGPWGLSPSGGPEPPHTLGPPSAAFRPGDAEPPGGCGTWTLTIPGGRRFTMRLDPVPVYDCDHRYESRGYQPADRLRHLVQVRDGTCTFPPCNRHASESDFEHAQPYHLGGRTCACNAGARSRACHRVKQSKGWKVTQPKPGWHQWRTPSGRIYLQEPWRYPA